MRAAPFISLLVLLIASPAAGAPPKPRPYAGSGLLVIRPFPAGPANPCTLVLYRAPGVGRIAEPVCDSLPQLTRVMVPPATGFPVAVMGKKGDWLNIAYDEAGREGWVAKGRTWAYLPWDEFLPGRAARLLPGLQKRWYAVRQAPAETARDNGILTPQDTFRIDEIRDGWARIRGDAPLSGWLQWRDGGGRLLIFIGN